MVEIEVMIGFVWNVCLFGFVLVVVEVWVCVIVVFGCFDEGEVDVCVMYVLLVDIVLLV